ncbi:Phosphate-repressible phosphate permease pho-4 [Smittium mucronatum]|uniref:Phosphate transporter n=1 Tax=Smittium mucronatum TaxID=133383 RepID=A0A1R0GUF3_9FUNG|nr:Phosphate-repressible phosphate permease pho-4 [Smittium mucronatum]
MMNPHQYTYIYVLALIFSFADAYGIGANDVANSFATSVSSGTLTLGQATCIAIVTEFCGAFFLGSSTADTIRSGIVNVNRYASRPELLMLGMTTSVFASAVWVIFATSRGWPVSTTHSITGAVIGMGIASFGGGSVKWGYDGVAKIITSWFVSPLAAALLSSIIYLITRYLVFERGNDSFKRGLYAIPFYILITVWVCIAYIISKGLPGTKQSKLSFGHIVGIGCAAGAGAALIAYFTYVQWLKRKLGDGEDLKWYHIPFVMFLSKRPIIPELTPEEIEAAAEKEKEESEALIVDVKQMSLFEKCRYYILRGVKQDVRNIGNPKLQEIHARAKKFDNKTETLFEFIQVLTACATSFAHGSNDVANAVGPLAAVSTIWSTGKVPGSKSPVSAWNLAFCAAGIDLGLATYGYHIMRTLGNNITYTTPSRGFAAELGTALTIMTASQIGLPVSSTHCITGAIVGVGLCNGDIKAINWAMFVKVFFSWIMTLPVAGLISGLMFAIIANAPQK